MPGLTSRIDIVVQNLVCLGQPIDSLGVDRRQAHGPALPAQQRPQPAISVRWPLHRHGAQLLEHASVLAVRIASAYNAAAMVLLRAGRPSCRIRGGLHISPSGRHTSSDHSSNAGAIQSGSDSTLCARVRLPRGMSYFVEVRNAIMSARSSASPTFTGIFVPGMNPGGSARKRSRLLWVQTLPDAFSAFE